MEHLKQRMKIQTIFITMNIKNAITFLFGLTLLFSSCFEVREEVNVKDDGTGDIKLVVNFSESKENVKKYLGIGKAGDVNVPNVENLEKILNHALVTLRGIKGMSQVEAKKDYEDFIFTFSAKFDDLEAVNEAVSAVTKQLSYLYIPHLEEKNFSFADNQFTRHFDYPIEPAEYKELPSMQRYFLESAKTVSIYRFGRTIEKYSNKRAILSPSGKAIKLETSLADLASGNATLENTISFKAKP